jgi:SAM-dependent methyltransferase
MTAHEAHLASEREFFDHEADSIPDEELLLPQREIDRYRYARPHPANAAKDALFARVLPLDGKAVLDYGCGTGENAVLLAACGARVTAFDLSPRSVAKGRQRAELHGLADRIRFDVREAGATGYPPASFDFVFGFAILHHLHTILPRVFEEVSTVLKPHGTACFIEPVSNSKTMSALRSITPVARYATEHECQLRYRDFDPLSRHFSSVEFLHFSWLGRLNRLTRGWGTRQLLRVDHYAQRAIPFLRRYYGRLVVIARR